MPQGTTDGKAERSHRVLLVNGPRSACTGISGHTPASHVTNLSGQHT
ncbi:hypothetical protein [Streptomyces lydicus]